MPYTTFISTIVYLDLALEAPGGLNRTLTAIVTATNGYFRNMGFVWPAQAPTATTHRSNTLQYAIRNLYTYHCLLGFASRGP
jgi:hypothetical protein